MISKKNNSKNSLTEDIHTRISPKEKRKIEKQANKCGMTKSEYLREMISSTLENEKDAMICANIVTLCQDLVNYVQEKYGNDDDKYLEGKVRQLWDAL